ncbi:uncharacterized protein PAC_00885 [Phialocephala subalpina]|uniref:Uncharacterized protein n=1 Tax=Phialocephala subalpina TaxID=576137 RepID=A0A1L7WE01_9HELO|nr:uncharacterized protein PAC_00885 [Phialocephala subalpina]
MAEDLSRKPSEPEHAKGFDATENDEEYVSRHSGNVPPSGRQRAASCQSMSRARLEGQPRTSISPFMSWDDSALINKHYAATKSRLNVTRDSHREGRHDKTLRGAEKDELQMGIALRRTESVNVFDDSASDTYLSSRPSSPAESDFGVHSGVDFVEKRLLHPDEYFQELDDLGSKIFEKSMFHFYIEGMPAVPFDGTIRFKAPFLENASFQNCTTAEILSFCEDVTSAANTTAFNGGPSAHYVDHRMHHREIAQLAHFIECRNIMSAVWENVKEMQSAAYCGQFISLLVLDRSRHGVAKLVRIECSKIEKLAIAFEICLLQVVLGDPATVLFDILNTISNDVSAACRELLAELDLNVPSTNIKDIWRCAVHILDVAVLSYAGAHTQPLGDDSVTSVELPGPFLETQYFIFRRRSFSCLSEFLADREAWVLEENPPHTIQVDLPRLSLSTDAVTFGDIWGPMWKSYILGDEGVEERILQYNVGNGVILPWNLPSPTPQNATVVRKGEIYCHWISNEDSRENQSLANSSGSSSGLHENDILLIGASVRLAKLRPNDKCESSVTDQRERLRNSGSLSEPGTIRNGKMLSAETFQAQVSPPYLTLGFQREYKRRGRTMKQVLVEDWKQRPLNRKIRCLEFKLGLEVSTCTHNARRIRLIKLLGTHTMLNHLKGGLLKWTSIECEEKFYLALQDSDPTAFRKLYESQPGWQNDLGNAIGYCLDELENTGKIENDLELFWAPGAAPGRKVTLRSSELSWIGFLEETESSGTLAVLEDKCLQLPTLRIGKKCQNDHFDPRHIDGKLTSNGGAFEGSILETSVNLNETCVPDSIRQGQGLVKNVRRNRSAPRHQYRWSLSSLEEGDKFKFGAKGSLKAISQLSQGQILAKWSPDILQSIRKSTVLGSLFDKPVEKMHHEFIRDEEEKTQPVHFLIISTAKSMLYSRQPSRRSSLHASATSVVSGPRPYVFDPTQNGQPRTTPSQSVLTQDGREILRDILNNWRIQPLLDSLESSLQLQ